MAEPPITVRASYSSFAAGDNLPIHRVVIHATCPNVGFPAASGPGAQRGTALFFASGNAGGSAHYVEGVDGEEHCVPEGTIAYHAPPNQNSVGIEITAEGGDYPNNYSRAQWLSPQVWPAVLRAAARTADVCARYGIPIVRLSPADLLAGRRGICGHVDVSQAWHETDHSDPGPDFPWPEFMAAVDAGGDDMFSDQDRALLQEVQKRLRGGDAKLDMLQQLSMKADFTNKILKGDHTDANDRLTDLWNQGEQAKALLQQILAAVAASGGAVDPKALAAAMAEALPKADAQAVAKELVKLLQSLPA